MDLAEELDDPEIPIVQACAALGISRATLYRQTQPAMPASVTVRGPSPRRLSDLEQQAVLDALHSNEFVDQPPPEVYARLLSRGVYLASIRTMYRLLAAFGESAERRAQREPMKHVKPTLTATAPNQVWTWDITKLRGPLQGVFYCLYVVLDLFSRMTVGWLLAERESAELAEHLFAETVARHGVEPGALTVHADRGSAMRSDGLAQLLGSLGVVRSFSRPHVSDDNAFYESQFKTLSWVAASAIAIHQAPDPERASQRDPLIEFSRGLSQICWHFPKPRRDGEARRRSQSSHRCGGGAARGHRDRGFT